MASADPVGGTAWTGQTAPEGWEHFTAVEKAGPEQGAGETGSRASPAVTGAEVDLGEPS